MSDNSIPRFFRALAADGRLWWWLLLLPVVAFLPALPIDETRYLAVAWEMRQHLDFLVPHLNGAPYSDKPPLLFWLVNAGWLVAGMHVWAVRLGMLAASFASLVLFERLVLRLEPDPALARRAVTLLFGTVFFALFSGAIMFDVLLATCVLIALHGALDLDAQRWRRGFVLLALGFGLGILTKGPVVLLDAGFALLLGPGWSDTARANKRRWYAMTGLAVLGGAAIALAWAIPAAIMGGEKYADAIFLRQTVDRMANSFAHRRPLWWYFMVLPAMVLPWTLAARAPWRAWRDSFHVSKSARFAVAWAVPAFVAFCFVSGKQPHYLLPLLPALALYLAKVLGSDGARVRGRLFGVLLLAAGLLVAALPYLATHVQDIGFLARMLAEGRLTVQFLHVISGIWPLWGVLVAVVGLFVLCVPRAHSSLRTLALSSVAAAALGLLVLAQGIGPYVDVSAAAARIRQDQDSGRPIAHLAWHHGLYEFAGRLAQPLEKVDFGDLRAWCAAHPDGEVVTFYSKYPITVKPDLELPYRFGFIRFWRAQDLLAMPWPAQAPPPDLDETPED
ncbi:MAG: glycosyltransferase family 39 protein [Proteobacteria bacterium]|nr:glycosyltransferase family 39 protein [Pseudomonadota bacterium]